MQDSSANKRLSVVTIDQIISGASNLLFAILAAHTLGVEGFAQFSILLLGFATVVAIQRAVLNEPLMSLPEEAEADLPAVFGAAVFLGVVAAVLSVASSVAAFVVGQQDMGYGLLVLAAALPLLLVQDTARYASIGFHHPERALIVDVLWLVLAVSGVALTLITDTRSLPLFVAIWAVSGCISACVGLAQIRVLPGHPLRWLRRTWSLSWRYAASISASQGAMLGATVVVGAIAGTAAVAAVRGSLILIRPFVTIYTAAVAAGVAEFARIREWGESRIHERRLLSVLGGIAVANAVVLIVLPDFLGRLVLSDTWAVAEPLMPALGVQIIALALISGPRAIHVGLRQAGRVMRLDFTLAGLATTAIIVGAAWNGALGALWGVALAHAVLVLAWRWSVRNLKGAEIATLRSQGLNTDRAEHGAADEKGT